MTVTKFSVQSSLERVRISWNSAEASRQCCLCSLSSAPLPGAQGSKWLNGRSVWLAFRRSWFRIPTGSRIFSMDLISLSQQKHHHSWAPTVNSIKQHKASEAKIHYSQYLCHLSATETEGNHLCLQHWKLCLLTGFWVIYRKATKSLTNLVTWYCLVFRPPNLLDTNSKSV